MSPNLQRSPARALTNFIVADLETKWILPSATETQAVQGESLNEALRFFSARKPCGPHLDGHAARVARTTAPTGIHQQISEPPSPATVRESQADKPDFVTAAGGE